MKTEKIKKEKMESQFTKVPVYFINNFNSFTKNEFSIILFILNFNFESGIETNKVYKKLGMQQSHFSRAMKSLIEKGVMKKVNGDYILIIPNESGTDCILTETNIDEIDDSGEVSPVVDVVHEEKEIVQPASLNVPEIDELDVFNDVSDEPEEMVTPEPVKNNYDQPEIVPEIVSIKKQLVELRKFILNNCSKNVEELFREIMDRKEVYWNDKNTMRREDSKNCNQLTPYYEKFFELKKEYLETKNLEVSI
jgi:DNA-binding Lrp family transcriptional regulator